MEIFKRHRSGVLNQNDANTLATVDLTNGKPINDADGKQFGLVNFGNTCYANSILQALYFCKPFRQFVCEFNDGSLPLPLPIPVSPTPAPPAAPLPKPPGLSPFPFRRRESTINAGRVDDHSSVSSKNNVSTPASVAPPTLFSALRSLFLHIALNPTDKGTVSPNSFIDKVKEENPAYRSAMHQDAHEFLGFLLNRVAENIKAPLGSLPDPSSATNSSGSTQRRRAGDTFIQDLFEGTLTSETRCLTCESVSSRDESFLDLSIDIDQNSSITACLRQFSASEMLAQKNKFFCDACGSLQEAEKRMKIKKLPDVLALHLKRFKYQEDRYVKLSYRVPFPFELRLFNTIDDAPDPDRLYQLFAIIVHIGVGAQHGHYITIIKSRGTWYTFDDENVQPIREGDISKYFGGTSGESGYVLFYQAADLESEPASPETFVQDGSITALPLPSLEVPKISVESNAITPTTTTSKTSFGTLRSASFKRKKTPSSASITLPNHNTNSDVPQLPPLPPMSPARSKDKDPSSTAPSSLPIISLDGAPLESPSPPTSPVKRRNIGRPATSPSSFPPSDTLKAKAPSEPLSNSMPPAVPSRTRSFSASTSMSTVDQSHSKDTPSQLSSRQSMPPPKISVVPGSAPPPVPERSPHRDADKPKSKSKRKLLQSFLGMGH